VQYVATVGISLVLLVLFANLLIDLYARGAIRDALDEGVRAAAPRGSSPHACEARAAEVLSGLLHGPVGHNVHITCRADAGVMEAHASGSLPSWLPMVVPRWRVSLQATMRVES
jgi:hypothetical protein